MHSCFCKKKEGYFSNILWAWTISTHKKSKNYNEKINYRPIFLRNASSQSNLANKYVHICVYIYEYTTSSLRGMYSKNVRLRFKNQLMEINALAE